jgi:hypothetical protein
LRNAGSDGSNQIRIKRIEIGSIFGAGEADVTYISPYITYIRTINERLSLSSKITYSVASGSFGQRGAFGDAYLIKLQLETKTDNGVLLWVLKSLYKFKS